ncbi:hypothetical protein GCK72_015414 [Caenorhabditis remanei]|uniref:Sdz-33 F-box domain-containing protein n=1 Tax=Caenorhabditis remanei TaxID=31234 RepID=A0A6A5GWE6_CAERE|nr:hypothetical protein GCK72_015414 [Caenorhabditis remanei]KAF1758954.1 hypothetical protein GCK72_015414 [Caenorhabditis remanei]
MKPLKQLSILRIPFRAMEEVSKGMHSIIKMISNRRNNEFPILRLPFLAIEEVLKAMDPIEISDRITNEEWNSFLKKWIAMETNQNLECLELSRKHLEEFRALVLHDIPHEVVDGGVKRVLKNFLNRTDEINGGIDIRRIDGRTATFFTQFDNFWMSVH